MGDFNVEKKRSHLDDFSKLPDELIEEILTRLPAEYLCKFSIVCKQWKTLFSSTGFITKKWALAPPNKKPWLVVGAVEENGGYFSAYSWFTRSWKIPCLSLSFLEGKEGPVRVRSRPFHYLGSASGLFLIAGNFTSSTYVCNPLTGKLFILPRMKFINCVESTMRGIVQEGENGYKVVALDNSTRHEQKIVEIYDSTEKSWRVAGILPRNLRFRANGVIGARMAFCQGFLYCLTAHNPEDSIMVFNMRNGASLFVPLPEYIAIGVLSYIQLVTCESRILLVAGMGFPGFQMVEGVDLMGIPRIGMAGEVIMWEFGKEVVPPDWKEIHRRRTILFGSYDCIGMRDCVCFKESNSREIAVYSLTQNSWTFLPTCPTALVTATLTLSSRPSYTALIEFEPRPDMKVQ
jgi:hypothetical protein